MAGVRPISRHSLQIVTRGTERDSLHCFKSMAGKESGPGAAFDDISSIAFIMSEVVNSISVRLDVSSELNNRAGSTKGSLRVLNTDLVREDFSHISIRSGIFLFV